MSSNDRLEELKREVKDLSNKQELLQMERDRTKEIVSYRKQEKEQNEQEMISLIRNVFEQSEIAEIKDRELLQDKLDRFNHRQIVMNEQLIALNDFLKDTTSLQSLYEAKREELELDYQNQRKALQGQIKILDDDMEAQKIAFKRLNAEIDTKTSELDKIIAETKKKTFRNEFKQRWVDKWLVFVIVGFVAMILGSFVGWGVFELIGSIFSSIFD